MAVYRVYVEKKSPFDVEAQGVLSELRSLLGIEGLDRAEAPQPLRRGGHGRGAHCAAACPSCSPSRRSTIVHTQLPEADEVFAVEYLPGQFDQRADSCAECVQLRLPGRAPRRAHGEGLPALRLRHAGGARDR